VQIRFRRMPQLNKEKRKNGSRAALGLEAYFLCFFFDFFDFFGIFRCSGALPSKVPEKRSCTSLMRRSDLTLAFAPGMGRELAGISTLEADCAHMR